MLTTTAHRDALKAKGWTLMVERPHLEHWSSVSGSSALAIYGTGERCCDGDLLEVAEAAAILATKETTQESTVINHPGFRELSLMGTGDWRIVIDRRGARFWSEEPSPADALAWAKRMFDQWEEADHA